MVGAAEENAHRPAMTQYVEGLKLQEETLILLKDRLPSVCAHGGF